MSTSAPSDLLLDVVRLTNVLTYLLTYADGGHRVRKLLPCSVLVTAFV